MAITPEEVGLLLVHGIGEQKQLEHLRCTAREIASYVETTPGLRRLSVDDQSEKAGLITIDAEFVDAGARRRVRFNCREVWWADLGMRGGMVAEAAFWLWGLGQWAAEVHFIGRKLSNTSKLMKLPHFRGDEPGKPPGIRRSWVSRSVLFGAGMLALLTLATWWLVKRIVTFIAGKVPSPTLIFLFLGDVKIYQQPGGPGRGTQEDPNMPRRATIRRRMVSAMTAMAGQNHRWYILAHSLGSVLAFNAIEETELALPNYLSSAEWDHLSPAMKTKTPYIPKGVKPTTTQMMPRRPPWLGDRDGISRVALFDKFAGFVTYGAPLDKYAALWPRIVCRNKQPPVFPPNCEWLNLYDPTDPGGASLDAFGTLAWKQSRRTSLVPKNCGCRSSKAFLLSHIRYFTPQKRKKDPMAAAMVDALLRNSSLVASARKIANSKARNAARMALAIIEVVFLFVALTLAATALILFGKDVLFGSYPACTTHWWNVACAKTFGRVSIEVFVGAIVVVFVAGFLRAILFDRWFEGR